MEGRVVLLGDFNTHSPERNLHCGGEKDEAGLKVLLEGYSLIQNKEPGVVTRLTCTSMTSIIHLTFTSKEVTQPHCLVSCYVTVLLPNRVYNSAS